VRFLDDQRDLGVPVNACGKGIGHRCAELGRNRQIGLRRQILIPEHQHLMIEKGLAHGVEPRPLQRRQVNAQYLGAQRASQRADIQILVSNRIHDDLRFPLGISARVLRRGGSGVN